MCFSLMWLTQQVEVLEYKPMKLVSSKDRILVANKYVQDNDLNMSSKEENRGTKKK